MTTADPVAPPEEGELPPGEGWAEAGAYENAATGFDHGLVALAMGLPYVLREKTTEAGEGGGYALLVPPEARDVVREQLELFERENAGWPPAPRREVLPGRWRDALFFAVLWALGAMGVFAAQTRWPELAPSLAMDARAVFSDGEWWRPFTALFLHADAGHLMSNLPGGVFLFAAVLSVWGGARGAALLVASAAMGNLAVGAANFPAEYRSLGASTAVFAALGLLTGRAVRTLFAEHVSSKRWRALLAPLGAGATMLMLYGAGAGETRVDVPAHAAGFVAGLLAGVFFAGAGKRSGETAENERP